MPEQKGPPQPNMAEIMSDPKKAAAFFANTPAEAWESIEKKTAISVAQEATEKIPAYQDFLNSHKFLTETISWDNFSQLPISDKENYVLKYGFENINLVKPPRLYSFSLSSGTVDEPTIWPRYYQYEEFLPAVFDIFMQLYWQTDKRSTLLVNAFNMGVWISGITVNSAIRPLTQKYPITLATTGSDLDSIVHSVKQLSKYYDQTIFFSYPTFVRTIFDRLEESGMDIRSLNCKMFMAGEGHTIEWKNYMNKKISGNEHDFTSIIDGYGVTDVGLVGLATAFTNLIRDTAFRNKRFAEDFFGSADNIPTLFQYNPGVYFIEEYNGELLFTTKSTTPLVRYNLHDRGGISSFKNAVATLKKHGYDYEKLIQRAGLDKNIVWKWPLIYVFGRENDVVIIGGGNVYPEHIAPVIFNENVKDIHSFKLEMRTDSTQHQMMYILLELKAGIHYTPREIKKIQKKYHDLILQHLLRVNSDWAIAYQSDPKYCDPVIEIYERSCGPFKDDLNKSKPRLVVRKK